MEIPPVREISHEINLIDENKWYNYRLPKCPDSLRPELAEKIKRYTTAGWWVPATARQAAPMLCVHKKSGKLRTVIDFCLQNDNLIKDVTPFPDQDAIRHDVARAKFHSKLDMSEAYEQIRVKPEHMPRTAFATIFGTFESRVMQMGDSNAPSTFQRLMTSIFRDFVGRFVHVYLDDIFIYSRSIEEHEEQLYQVLITLRNNHLFLSKSKIDLYSENMDCLGHLIDNKGIHADIDKMQKIRDWRRPRNYNKVQRFLGLVQYLAHYMPDISAYTSPLSGCVRNNRPFTWTPLLEKCLESIKTLACKAPILKPIDPDLPEPIWVITDGSKSGVGAVYGQGPNWQSCRPAGFLSKKFSSAQQNYRSHEHETIAILEALMKWEDKLLGRKFTLVTDNKGLEYFKTQPHLSPRQVRWWEFLSRFSYNTLHVDGVDNKVADCLSRYYESDNPGEIHPAHIYINADVRLDPEGELLPVDRFVELRVNATKRFSKRIADKVEQRVLDSEEMNAGIASKPTRIAVDDPSDALALASAPDGRDLRKCVERNTNLAQIVRDGYLKDSTFNKVLQHPEAYPRFGVRDGLVYTKNQTGQDVVCLPCATLLRGRRLIEVIIDHAHQTIGHFGQFMSSKYIRRFYWWPAMAADIHAFCETCAVCQTSKADNRRPAGLLHTLPVPNQPWESIGMDFMGPLPMSKDYDYLLVIIDRFTSQVHLIPTTTRVTSREVVWLFLKEVVRLHGVPDSIVSDRDSKFTAIFWRELQRLLGVKLLMSTAFHPQTDGATEQANRSIAQVLRTLVDFNQKNWADKCPMVEFALNSNISTTTGYAPFELNGGYMPQLGQRVKLNTPYRGVKQFAQQALWNMMAAHDAMITNRVNQTYHANKRRREGEVYSPGDLVYLSTQNLSLPKGRARKLLPKYIGPYKIIEVYEKTSNVKLELPPELVARRITPTFHINLIRPHVPNDDERFPRRDTTSYYDFGGTDESE